MGTFSRARILLSGIALLVFASVAGCSSASKSAGESRGPQVKWYAHCDVCKWCKGSFRASEEVQEVVTNHNKQEHDWYKVAYYNQVKCP